VVVVPEAAGPLDTDPTKSTLYPAVVEQTCNNRSGTPPGTNSPSVIESPNGMNLTPPLESATAIQAPATIKAGRHGLVLPAAAWTLVSQNRRFMGTIRVVSAHMRRENELNTGFASSRKVLEAFRIPDGQAAGHVKPPHSGQRPPLPYVDLRSR